MAPARKKQRLSNGSAATAESPEDAVAPTEATAEADPTTSQAQEVAVQQRRSLFVRSLPATSTSESLTELFSDLYPVKHAVAVTDPATKECRGYGFVTFADAEDAAKAKEHFNNHLVDGRKIRIEIAEMRKRKDGEEGGESTKGRHKDEPQQPPKLIVRNLPWSIKKGEQLSKLFMSYGKIKQAYIPKKGPGLMAGFGFVIMRGKKNAEKAIEGINGKEVDGRTLAVDWAVDKDTFQGLTKTEEEDEEDEDVVTGAAVDEEMADDVSQDAEDDEQDSGENELEDDEDNELDGEDEDEDPAERKHDPEDRSSTLFVRNLPFTCTDEDLEDHFEQFGNIRYARVVMDHETGRSKGTGFVCFYDKTDADTCIRNAPVRIANPAQEKGSKDGKAEQPAHSILQNEYADPSGQYTLDGRVLQVSKAVEKSEAKRLTQEGVAHRYKRDGDKRRLYLLSEGTISSKSKLWEQLSPSERAMREASAKQRKTLIESNPSLHLSLTRLSVRNIPRSVGSKELKALARDAVVGFATDVKAGTREKLSREDMSRGGDEMVEAEKARKKAGKGVVKQAKVVFESTGGSKVAEESGAGRSRGYGFIEYYTHRNALMGLRWLNGHAVGYQVKDGNGKLSRDDVQDRKKRLIVEFAIENAQVVLRRKEIEEKAKARSQAVKDGVPIDDEPAGTQTSKSKAKDQKHGSRKRKRDSEVARSKETASRSDKTKDEPAEGKLARRNQIIGRKRAMRRARKDGKS